MVKKVKRYIVLVLFSFFYSIFITKESRAESAGQNGLVGCIVPKGENGKLLLNGNQTDQNIDENWCY